MDERSGDQRDLLGDQMRWATRKLLPPTPELYKLDRTFMRALPLNLRRTVALIRFHHGWLPEMGNPQDAYNKMLRGLCQIYINQFGEINGFNTVLIPTTGGEPLKIQHAEFKQSDKEKPIKWDKQIEWAQNILSRQSLGEYISTDYLKETMTILQIQGELTTLFEKMKPQFVKRGFPFPWQPKEIHPKSEQK